MKKLIAIGLISIMAMNMTACGGSTEESAPAENASAASDADTPAESVVSVKDYYQPGEEYPTVPDTLEPVTLKLAHGNSEEQQCQADLEEFKRLVEERSGGKLCIDIYSNGSLGNDSEAFQSMLAGDIEAVWQPVMTASNYIDDAACFDLAAYYTDMNELNDKLGGSSFRDVLQSAYREKGAELLTMYCYGFRTLTCNKMIESFDDFQGLDIRTMENPYHMQFWKALGANPTGLPWGEVYLALQQGMLDAQENPINSILTGKIGEVQKYFFNTNHQPFVATIVMNGDYYNALPDEYKVILKTSVADMRKWTLDNYEAKTESDRAELAETGCEYVELNDEILSQMSEVAQEQWNSIRTEVLSENMVNAMKETFGK